MKKIFLFIALFSGLIVSGQGNRLRPIFKLQGLEIDRFAPYEIPPGYTNINSRLQYIALRATEGFHIPGYSTTPNVRSGVWVGAGNIGIDTVANRMYFYSSGVFQRLAKFSELGTGSTNSNVGSGYRWALPNTNNIKTLTATNGLTPDSATSNQIGVKWGGTLTENTTIAGADTYATTLTGTLLAATGTFGSGTTPSVTGAGVRMFFYPKKAAFRSGSVNSTQWDDANIGDYSVAVGNSTRASGSYNFASGFLSNASATEGATAMGVQTVASGNYSTATGNSSKATGVSSFSGGQQSLSSGDISFSFGNADTATGAYSVAFNAGSKSSGTNSGSFGLNSWSKSYSGFVVGQFNDSTNATNAVAFNSANRAFQIGVGTSNSARANAMTVLFSGQLTLDQYTTSNFNGGVAADSVLVVTSAGVVKKRDAASFGGGSNFANADLTFTGDRTHDLDNHQLDIIDGSNSLLQIDPITWRSKLEANDGTAKTLLFLTADSGDPTVNFSLLSHNATDTVYINGNPILKQLDLKADTIRFISTLSGATSGMVWTLADEATGSGYWGAGGGGTTIYTGDGTLASDRIVDLDGKILQFRQGSNPFLRIDPTVNNEDVFLRAYNDTGGNNVATFHGFTTATTASFELFAQFDDGTKFASITGFADATTSTLTYTADEHTINGADGKANMFNIYDGSGNNYFKSNSQTFETRVQATDGTSQTQLRLRGNSGEPEVNFLLSANDNTNEVKIEGSATSNSLSYTADTHTFNGNSITVPHIVGGGSIPSIAAGAGAGTAPTLTVGTGSTDIAGFLNITTGTLPTGTNATVATITFNTAFSAAPTSIILTPANALTALLTGLTMVFVDQASTTTTTFIIVSGTTALTAATDYKFFYQVIQ